MSDKMNLDHLKLFHCEFQKFQGMTMSELLLVSQKNPSYKETKHIERSSLLLVDNYYMSLYVNHQIIQIL